MRYDTITTEFCVTTPLPPNSALRHHYHRILHYDTITTEGGYQLPEEPHTSNFGTAKSSRLMGNEKMIYKFHIWVWPRILRTEN
jgi:hypothetical protein